MTCCKAEKYENWCKDLPSFTIDDGNEYCLFHAPKGKKGMSVDEFNKEVFKRIDQIIKNQIEDPELICDFSRTIFEGDIDFLKYNEDKPLRKVSFEQAQFEGKVEFCGAQFEKYANFWDAQFKGEANFEEAQFKGKAAFANVQFKRKAAFNVAHFEEEVIFVDAQFREDANFEEAQFKEVCFIGAHFEGNAEFRKAQFKGEADFRRVQFEGQAEFGEVQFGGKANFREVQFKEETNFEEVQFDKQANFWDAQFMKEANLWGAQFKGKAAFRKVHFEGKADFRKTQFKGEADLWGAQFKGKAAFQRAQFEKQANFWEVQFEGQAEFGEAQFKGEADFRGANLKNAFFQNSYLKGVGFQYAIVSGNTIIDDDCTIDRKTDFTGVGLDNARVGPKIKQLLKYNIRRIGWEEKYKKTPFKTLPWRLFWLISDYGMSTGRIIKSFLWSALYFSCFYLLMGFNDFFRYQTFKNPGIIDELFSPDLQNFIISIRDIFETVLRSIYFSVVTMTTLGFGDMHVKPHSFWGLGYIFVTIQVLLGYVLLGALITRLTILFTQDGPPANFPEEKKGKKSQDKIDN